MRAMRALLNDRLATGLMAGLLCYFFVFQGFAAAFAKGEMAGAPPAFVLCLPSSDGSGLQPSGAQKDHCCSSLCQIGCSVSGLVAQPAAPFAHTILPDYVRAVSEQLPSRISPHALGLAAAARAPPAILL